MELRIGQTCGIVDHIGTYLGQDEQGRHVVKYQTQRGREAMETVHAVPYKPIPVDRSLIGRYVAVKDMQMRWYAQITDLEIQPLPECEDQLTLYAVLSGQLPNRPCTRRRLDELEILDRNPFWPKEKIRKRKNGIIQAARAILDKRLEIQQHCRHEWELEPNDEAAGSSYSQSYVCRICLARDAVIALK